MLSSQDLDAGEAALPEQRGLGRSLPLAQPRAGSLLSRTASTVPVLEPWAQALVNRADLVISQRAGDPRFSVTALASDPGVTSTHPSRAFREAGRPSPRQVIRDERRTIATTLLERGDLARGRLHTRTLARLSGFGSTNSPRRALRDG